MKILVVGGAGYIGTHAVKELLKAGYEVVVYDNLSSGFREALPQGINFIKGDLNNPSLLSQVFRMHNFDSVIDFAGHIEVSESMKDPAKFYRDNVLGLVNLLKIMQENSVRNIVYSSSASVYGEPKQIPIPEEYVGSTNNVYGETKVIAERMLNFFDKIYGIKSVCLRYFNASGADESGEIGENHNPETHLIPLIYQVPLGKRQHITIFGNDYPTKDGTCVRDYVHVTDLAQAHILAMKCLAKEMQTKIYNVGTGRGYSVQEIINAARKITGHEIPVVIGSCRFGDPAELVACTEKIKTELGWKPKMSNLQTIMETAWRWHKNHPEGYK
ncbi:MAG: UDP-glucose 4-epimerase GalE [Nanoarchaeota archaeon]|nr:UDP-glucose 4-epimerase GalE [Nanoarchaeota archaeon]